MGTTTGTTGRFGTALMIDASMAGLGGCRARVKMIVAGVFAATLSLGVSSASASSVDECVKRRTADGDTRAVAVATCLRESNEPTNEPSNKPRTRSSRADSATESRSEGTSPVVLIAVGLGGLLAGAGLATLLHRRSVEGAPAGIAPSGAPPARRGMLPGLVPPAPPAPGPPAQATADRSAGLVRALIDLADQVPSQALRAEILAALDRAGVHPLEPAVGDVFDVTRMRGVGNARAPDAGWVGRVAGTERAGYHDGATVLRLPEVVVYTAGG